MPLTFTVRLDKERFEEGEPIVLTLHLHNPGHEAYLVQTSDEETAALDGFHFEIESVDGRQLPAPPKRFSPATSIGSWQRILPHQKHERRVFLNYWFNPLVPGHYRVRATYQPRLLDGTKQIEPPKLAAPIIDFIIVRTTDQKIEVRVRRMSSDAQRGDPVAIDFLGFTGATEAAAPLLKILVREEPPLQRRAANALAHLPDRALIRQQAVDLARVEGLRPLFAEWLVAQKIEQQVLRSLFLAQARSQNVASRVGALTGLQRLYRPWPDDSELRATLQQVAKNSIEDHYPPVRQAAVLLLAGGSSSEVTPALDRLLKTETNAGVRMTASSVRTHLRHQVDDAQR